MSTTIEVVVLERALKLMEAGHCTHRFARDAAAYEVDVFSEDAVEFCAVGAIHRAYGEITGVRGSEQEEPQGEAFRIVSGVHHNLARLNDIFGLEMAGRLIQRRLDVLRGKEVGRALTIWEHMRVWKENNW